jgi:hypothetical protein
LFVASFLCFFVVDLLKMTELRKSKKLINELYKNRKDNGSITGGPLVYIADNIASIASTAYNRVTGNPSSVNSFIPVPDIAPIIYDYRIETNPSDNGVFNSMTEMLKETWSEQLFTGIEEWIASNRFKGIESRVWDKVSTKNNDWTKLGFRCLRTWKKMALIEYAADPVALKNIDNHHSTLLRMFDRVLDRIDLMNKLVIGDEKFDQSTVFLQEMLRSYNKNYNGPSSLKSFEKWSILTTQIDEYLVKHYNDWTGLLNYDPSNPDVKYNKIDNVSVFINTFTRSGYDTNVLFKYVQHLEYNTGNYYLFFDEDELKRNPKSLAIYNEQVLDYQFERGYYQAMSGMSQHTTYLEKLDPNAYKKALRYVGDKSANELQLYSPTNSIYQRQTKKSMEENAVTMMHSYEVLFSGFLHFHYNDDNVQLDKDETLTTTQRIQTEYLAPLYRHAVDKNIETLGKSLFNPVLYNGAVEILKSATREPEDNWIDWVQNNNNPITDAAMVQVFGGMFTMAYSRSISLHGTELISGQVPIIRTDHFSQNETSVYQSKQDFQRTDLAKQWHKNVVQTMKLYNDETMLTLDDAIYNKRFEEAVEMAPVVFPELNDPRFSNVSITDRMILLIGEKTDQPGLLEEYKQSQNEELRTDVTRRLNILRNDQALNSKLNIDTKTSKRDIQRQTANYIKAAEKGLFPLLQLEFERQGDVDISHHAQSLTGNERMTSIMKQREEEASEKALNLLGFYNGFLARYAKQGALAVMRWLLLITEPFLIAAGTIGTIYALIKYELVSRIGKKLLSVFTCGCWRSGHRRGISVVGTTNIEALEKELARPVVPVVELEDNATPEDRTKAYIEKTEKENEMKQEAEERQLKAYNDAIEAREEIERLQQTLISKQEELDRQRMLNENLARELFSSVKEEKIEVKEEKKSIDVVFPLSNTLMELTQTTRGIRMTVNDTVITDNAKGFSVNDNIALTEWLCSICYL